MKKYQFGNPIQTDAILQECSITRTDIPFFHVTKSKEGLCFSIKLDESDRIYGLGEQVRGINKRGNCYHSFNMDDFPQSETRYSNYGSHNFLLFYGKEKCFGVYFDDPALFTFDLGYTNPNVATMISRYGNLYVYLFEASSIKEIIKEFRQAIGRSYIPPKWAFGYIQSRYGGLSEKEIKHILKEYKNLNMPIDGFCIDIDCFDRYADFSWDKEKFPNPKQFIQELKDQKIHILPIVDAQIKDDENLKEYQSGIQEDVFCKKEDGSPFIGYVWSSKCVFPDYFLPQTRTWFANCYREYLDMGIDGFWNDMNEPAILATPQGLLQMEEITKDLANAYDDTTFGKLDNARYLLRDPKRDDDHFFVTIHQKQVPYSRVHNLYSAKMSDASAYALESYDSKKRYTLFSRASFIGSHRNSGIWTGDNFSWWADLKLNFKMLPSLNMCGYLYSGADIGGFGDNTTDDLLLRWLALGIFVPLFRNHSSLNTRQQEIYQFEYRQAMVQIIQLRYRLIPYLYSEFMKAVLNSESLFRPLSFDYPEDERTIDIEDQLMMGNELMLAPVMEQNAKGRYVYLPEEMMMIKFEDADHYTSTCLEKGDHYIQVNLKEVVFFIKKDKIIPIVDCALSTSELDYASLKLIGYTHFNSSYELYNDNGISKEVSLQNITILRTNKD